MAFNPLASIRVYLRPIMAVVGILTMFIFVFQFGRGDIFESALGWFSSRNRGPEVIKVFGETVHESDLLRDREDLEIVQEFLNNFIRFGGPANQTRMMQLFGRKIFSTAGAFNTRTAQGLIDIEIWRHLSQKLSITIDDERLREFLNAQLGTDPAKPFWPAGSAFGEIDFIKLMARGSRSGGGSDRVKQALRSLATLTITRDAVLGAASNSMPMFPMAAAEGIRFSPATSDPTPGEFDEFFKARQTRVSAAVVPLVASAELTDEVSKQVISPAELQDIYDRFKNVEPVPGSPTPGFMTPRNYRISWIAARPDNAKAALTPALLQVARVLGPVGAVGLHGAGPSAASALFTWADATTPGRTEIGDDIQPGVAFWCWLDPLVNPVDRRQLAGKLDPIEHKRQDKAFKPATPAVSPASLASLACPTHGPWSAFLVTTGVPELQPRQARLTRAATLAALTASGPGAQIFSALALATAPAAMPSLDTVAKEAAALVLEESRKSSFSRMVNSLTEEIRKAATDTGAGGLPGATADPVQTEEQIRSKAISMGLAYHSMQKPLDEESLQSDTTVQPLIAAYKENVEENAPNRSPLDPVRREADADFGSYIRNNLRGAFQPQEVGSVSASFADPDKPKNFYLFWAPLIENPVVRLFDNPQTKELVRNAIIKRRIADRLREKALKAVTAVNALGRGAMTNLDAKLQLQAIPELKGSAECRFIESLNAQTRTPAVMANMPVSYSGNRIPRDVIKYARPETIETLAAQGAGKAVVVNDVPGTDVYVAWVTSLTEPSPDEFTRAYQGATDRKTLGDKDQLYGDLAQSRQARYADRVIRDLRRDSTGKELDSDGLLPLPEGIRKRFERTESESP